MLPVFSGVRVAYLHLFLCTCLFGNFMFFVVCICIPSLCLLHFHFKIGFLDYFFVKNRVLLVDKPNGREIQWRCISPLWYRSLISVNNYVDSKPSLAIMATKADHKSDLGAKKSNLCHTGGRHFHFHSVCQPIEIDITVCVMAVIVKAGYTYTSGRSYCKCSSSYVDCLVFLIFRFYIYLFFFLVWFKLCLW